VGCTQEHSPLGWQDRVDPAQAEKPNLSHMIHFALRSGSGPTSFSLHNDTDFMLGFLAGVFFTLCVNETAML